MRQVEKLKERGLFDLVLGELVGVVAGKGLFAHGVKQKAAAKESQQFLHLRNRSSATIGHAPRWDKTFRRKYAQQHS